MKEPSKLMLITLAIYTNSETAYTLVILHRSNTNLLLTTSRLNVADLDYCIWPKIIKETR